MESIEEIAYNIKERGREINRRVAIPNIFSKNDTHGRRYTGNQQFYRRIDCWISSNQFLFLKGGVILKKTKNIATRRAWHCPRHIQYLLRGKNEEKLT